MEVGAKELKRQRELPITVSQDREPSGWDPYEVWRTRVLLPRLHAEEPAAPVEIRAIKIAISNAA
jgi:hypothetical protein